MRNKQNRSAKKAAFSQDNTGACVDMGIAGAMAGGIADYIMEVTQKTVTDIKVSK
jgi:UDP-N-acetylglucosamine pyrophosphorylase